MTHHDKSKEFNIDEVRNMPVEDLNEEQSKGLWEYTREQDLRMQQRLGFLSQDYDTKKAAKGGKDAKEAAKASVKGAKSEEPKEQEQQPKEDFEKKVKDFTKKF